MCDVHKTERAVHGPFSARLWSVQYPFESRLTSVLLKRSGVKRTLHGKFFLPYTVPAESVQYTTVQYIQGTYSGRVQYLQSLYSTLQYSIYRVRIVEEYSTCRVCTVHYSTVYTVYI